MAWKKMLLVGDELPVFTIRFGAEDASTTSTSYVTIANSDICINPTIFKRNNKLYVRFIYHAKNSTSGETTYVRVWRQNAGTAVSGSEKSTTGTDWACLDTGWIDWSDEPNTCESYQLDMKVTGGTGYCNCAIMILSSINF